VLTAFSTISFNSMFMWIRTTCCVLLRTAILQSQESQVKVFRTFLKTIRREGVVRQLDASAEEVWKRRSSVYQVSSCICDGSAAAPNGLAVCDLWTGRRHRPLDDALSAAIVAAVVSDSTIVRAVSENDVAAIHA